VIDLKVLVIKFGDSLVWAVVCTFCIYGCVTKLNALGSNVSIWFPDSVDDQWFDHSALACMAWMNTR
jgi:hypothetical protein